MAFQSDVLQEADQLIDSSQGSSEDIRIVHSCDVKVHTTDTQAAISLQAALQIALALVISISVGDSNRANKVTQELLQRIRVNQRNRQKLLIENSRDVSISTTDTDIAVNIQALLQVLVALVVKLDIF